MGIVSVIAKHLVKCLIIKVRYLSSAVKVGVFLLSMTLEKLNYLETSNWR
jgi:hypothetical protein